MSDLQTTEQNYFISRREEVEKDLMLPNKSFLEKTYDFRKIAELKTDPNFVFLVGGWITQTSMLMQIKNPIDRFVKQDIVNMLTGFWSVLSLEEMIKAFELERFGVFNDKTEHFQLFDCNYISSIFKKYQKWKREQKTELNISNQMEKEMVSEEEKIKLMTDAVNNKFIEFLNTKDISEPFAHIFKELVERGNIKMPNSETPKLIEYYNKKLDLAKTQILSELQNFTSEDKNKRLNIKIVVDSIINNIQNDDAKAKIEIRGKKLVLIDYFNILFSENKKLVYE